MLKRVKNILILIVILICLIVVPSVAVASETIKSNMNFDLNYYIAIVILIILVAARGVFALYELNKTTKLAVEEIEKAKETIKHPSDSSWIYENLISRAKICIYKFNEAVEKRDISYAKGYLSENLEDKLNKKIESLIENNQKEILENYRVTKLLPIKAIDEIDDNEDLIKIAIQVETFNYLIDSETGEIITKEDIALETIEETWTYIKRDNFWIAEEIEDFDLELDKFI